MIVTNIREAKAKLSSYLAQVEQGEEAVILLRGRPVALLRPVETPAPLPCLKEFRNHIKLKGLPASEMIIRMREEPRY